MNLLQEPMIDGDCRDPQRIPKRIQLVPPSSVHRRNDKNQLLMETVRPDLYLKGRIN